jgi:hypothetical protein
VTGRRVSLHGRRLATTGAVLRVAVAVPGAAVRLTASTDFRCFQPAWWLLGALAMKPTASLPIALALMVTAPSLAQAAPEAIATFESLGIYWKPPSDPGAEGCQVRFRRQADASWREGFPLWYDSRSIGGRPAECRGSLVHLQPGTTYEIELGLPGQGFTEKFTARTWSESFPIGETVYLEDGNRQLDVTSGGSPDGYKLLTFPPGSTTATLDVEDAANHNITISAPYVIVRGLTLRGAKSDAIKLLPGAHDVVIEENDISEWGRFSHTSSLTGWKIGVNSDSAISARCSSSWRMERLIVQRNRIHHPRYGSNSWDEGHPVGSNAIFFEECGGNHVWRYNEITSEWGRYFMDPIGGGENFSDIGFPNSDSDIHGNVIQHCWDDAIEAEGANRNVRIWGNYIDRTTTAIATSSTSVGPLYVWRNVYNRSRYSSTKPLDQEGRLYFGKTGSVSPWGGGRRYLFHNTLLQAAPTDGATYTLGAGIGIGGNGTSRPIENTVTRNNIWQIHKDWWASIDTDGGSRNDFDYDLYNGRIDGYGSGQPNGIRGVPSYAPGHGWSNEAGGDYQLDPESPGFDAGERLPNFNDDFLGAAPDIGAHESGSDSMPLGVNARPKSMPPEEASAGAAGAAPGVAGGSGSWAEGSSGAPSFEPGGRSGASACDLGADRGSAEVAGQGCALSAPGRTNGGAVMLVALLMLVLGLRRR